jgi:hypothetical protein
MPGGSNSKTFVGPRILTRRQFIRGLGGGAATLGLGYVQACSWCEKNGGEETTAVEPTEPTTPTNSDEVIRSYAGEKGLSYLDRKVTDSRMVDLITERAASFGQSCEEGDVPSDLEIILDTTMEELPGPIDAGGLATNDLRLISPVDLERSPVLMDYLSGKLGRDVTPDNAHCSFTTTRFFAAATSKADPLHQPYIGITDSVVASVHDESEQEDDQAAADVLVVDCAGINRRMRGTFDNSSRPPLGQKVDQSEVILGRDSLINAYFDHLVGYNLQGEKVYVPFDPYNSERDPAPRQVSPEYGGVRVVEYRKIVTEPFQSRSTPPPDANPQDPPNDANYPADIAYYQGQLSDAWPELPDLPSSGYFLAGGQTYAVEHELYLLRYSDGTLEHSWSLPDGAEERRGDPMTWSYNVETWRCVGNTFDGCVGCCTDKLGAAVGFASSICVGGIFAEFCPLVCAIAACVIAGGMILGSLSLSSQCQDGCNGRFWQVPGQPPRS